MPLPNSYTGGRFLPGPNQPEALRERFRHIIETHAHSHRPDQVLAAHGVDHTWLQRDIAAILRALPSLMPEVTFHHGTIEDALREWKRNMPADMKSWEGQLRGRLCVEELHGTLSSRIDNNVWNDRDRQSGRQPAAAPGAALRHSTLRGPCRRQLCSACQFT